MTLICTHGNIYQLGLFLQLLPKENQTRFFLPINSAAELARRVDTEQHNTSPSLENRWTQTAGLDYAIYWHQQTLVHIKGSPIWGKSLLRIHALQYEWTVQQEDSKSKGQGYKQFKSLSPHLWYLMFWCTEPFSSSHLLMYTLPPILKSCQSQLWGRHSDLTATLTNGKKLSFNSASGCSNEKREYQTWSNFLEQPNKTQQPVS